MNLELIRQELKRIADALEYANLMPIEKMNMTPKEYSDKNKDE
jgi:hypothetical protein